MNFNSGASDYPDYDPDGSKLTALMSSVETFYQGVFEASGTLTVNYYYDDIDALAIHTNTGTSSGKPTSCTIRIDTNRTWFIDETPFDNSEFTMTQYLYRDLSSTQKANYYNGSPPDFLEYAFKGSDNGTGPAESSNGYDLWSIMLHEMGHGMGMTSATAFWEAWWDEEYDVDPDLVWGASMAVPTYSSDDVYHIAGRTNMYPYSSVGVRTLPSATDIIAIETSCDWGDTTIDMPRQDFYSTLANADFNNRDYWEGHKLPDRADDVWVRHGNNATLSADISMNNLVVDEGVTVYTGAYRLYADQNATLGNGTNYARVYIQNGGEFQVDLQLTVNNNAKVQMATGSLLDVDDLLINTGGELIGAGTIDIEDALTNRGTITVSGGNLTINSAVSVNLDGEGGYDGDGEIYVTGGNFTCNKALTDTFSGHVQVDSGYTATFTEGWRIAGTLDLNGGTTSSTRARIGGGLFRLVGPTDVDLGCEITSDEMWIGAATVTLADSDDNLYLASGNETTIYDTATFTGAGRVYGLSGSSIILNDDVVIGVRFRAHGDLTIEEDGIGTATVDDSPFALGSTGTFLVEADGDDSCDLLIVDGTAYLAGTLDIDFIDSYTPDDGDSFTVLEYTGRSGTFDYITWDGLFDLVPTYGATSLTLTVFAGEGSTPPPVPEPSTLILLVSAVFALGGFRRKKH